MLGNFILLFGNPIQMLWLPARADPVVDVLYILVLAAFVVDMIFRSVAVAGYFGITVVRVFPSFDTGSLLSSATRTNSSSSSGMLNSKNSNSGMLLNNSNSGIGMSNKGDHGGGSSGGSISGTNGNLIASSKSSGRNSNNNGTKSISQKEKNARRTAKCLEAMFGWVRCLQMGSFLFWCDLVSTLTLFYDISYTNPNNYEMVQWNMELSGAGGIQPVRDCGSHS